MKQKSQAFAASSDSKCRVLICAPQGRPRVYFYFAQRSFTTSPAIISPTTDGTNATLPGISLLSVHLCSAPGGQIQWFLQLIAISSFGLVGCSSDYTTFSFFTPRFFSSRRITFASGHTFVL